MQQQENKMELGLFALGPIGALFAFSAVAQGAMAEKELEAPAVDKKKPKLGTADIKKLTGNGIV